MEWVQDPLPVSPPEGTTHLEWPSFAPQSQSSGSVSGTAAAPHSLLPPSEQPPWQAAAAAAIRSDGEAESVSLAAALSPADGDEEHLHSYIVNGKSYDFSQLILDEDEDPVVSGPSA